MSFTKADILVWSRFTGRLLAVVLVAVTALGAVQMLRFARAQSVLGYANGQAFIADVRACRHNGPKPRPAWPACERIVRKSR